MVRLVSKCFPSGRFVNDIDEVGEIKYLSICENCFWPLFNLKFGAITTVSLILVDLTKKLIKSFYKLSVPQISLIWLACDHVISAFSLILSFHNPF